MGAFGKNKPDDHDGGKRRPSSCVHKLPAQPGDSKTAREYGHGKEGRGFLSMV